MPESSVRFSRKKAFTTLYREVAQDSRLSLESRGLLLLMASLPEDWEYSVAGLAKKAGCGRDKLRRILEELERVGYLAREQRHDPGGKFSGNLYVVQDEAPPLPENPATVSTVAGKTVNGKTVNGKTVAGFPDTKVYYLTVEDNNNTPKAPSGGKEEPKKERPKKGSKYALDEEAKPILRSYVGDDRELAQTLAVFIEVREAKKAINSARAISMLLRELDKLSQGRREDKLLILQQSITNSWKGVFPLKGGQTGRNQTAPGDARVMEEEGTYLL